MNDDKGRLGMWLCSIGLAILMLNTGCQKKVNLASLITEMTSHDNLSYFPRKQYRHIQFSSYNRESVNPGTEGWFANEDMSHFIRVE